MYSLPLPLTPLYPHWLINLPTLIRNLYGLDCTTCCGQSVSQAEKAPAHRAYFPMDTRGTASMTLVGALMQRGLETAGPVEASQGQPRCEAKQTDHLCSPRNPRDSVKHKKLCVVLPSCELDLTACVPHTVLLSHEPSQPLHAPLRVAQGQDTGPENECARLPFKP